MQENRKKDYTHNPHWQSSFPLGQSPTVQFKLSDMNQREELRLKYLMFFTLSCDSEQKCLLFSISHIDHSFKNPHFLNGSSAHVLTHYPAWPQDLNSRSINTTFILKSALFKWYFCMCSLRENRSQWVFNTAATHTLSCSQASIDQWLQAPFNVLINGTSSI